MLIPLTVVNHQQLLSALNAPEFLGALLSLQNAIDEAVEMYQELHMWDDCIAVAEARVSFFKRFGTALAGS